MKLSPSPVFQALLGHVYALSGEKAKAVPILDGLIAMSAVRFVSPIDFAIVYAGLNDTNKTFHWLEEGHRTRATRIHELPSMYFDNMRSDPRYATLLERVGLSSSAFLRQ